MTIYLGFDLSTQSLTVSAIEVDGTGRVSQRFEHALEFDAELPRYGTRHGVLPSSDPLVATSSPLMWAEALERMMAWIAQDSGVAVADIGAIAGSAQQHGSVYLDASAGRVLGALDPARPLVEQLRGVFAREDAPIWMDVSAGAECEDITKALGGPLALATLTGSRAFERFTGPQIRKVARRQPEVWARTERVHLVSSYAASLLIGAHAMIEPGDGAGMNLMDIRSFAWAEPALDATAPELRRRLPDIVPSSAVVGPLAPYWRSRHGFPAADVVAFSGDNPCTLIGTGIIEPGLVAISLGTSDTLMSLRGSAAPDPSLTGHVAGAPTGGHMAVICCRNGSLARERVANEYQMDWPAFERAVRSRPAGNRGAIMLPWFEPEIVPPVKEPGVRRYRLSEADGPANARAVVEAQMLSLAIHSQWMGGAVRTIHATGGASQNRAILQVMADVFAADVVPLASRNTAALGAALRAWHGAERARGRERPWRDIVPDAATPTGPVVRPDPRAVAIYQRMRTVYAACEAHALGHGGDPTPLLSELDRSA